MRMFSRVFSVVFLALGLLVCQKMAVVLRVELRFPLCRPDREAAVSLHRVTKNIHSCVSLFIDKQIVWLKKHWT